MCAKAHIPEGPFSKLPFLSPPKLGNTQNVPSEEDCYALWAKYNMRDNIKQHSQIVGTIAKLLAKRANDKGIRINIAETYASGLLHDLAKTWCLEHKGSHAMLGASWVVQETGNYAIAQGVILHVHWPWPLPEDFTICQLPILVIYADKRTMHNKCVTLDERFADLLVRYGKTEQARQGIRASFEQSKKIEKLLSNQLGWNLNEHSFDCGRLVQ